ncbi:carboxypeptidase-like regulatory domain-containing protein [Falsiroseomonas oryzae]|uniref:carboxypeptidase-like regulatory domain-containing protein n=1 Tax=Falsiroseomonas oryzae TaxID=2766473 RepID=UPI0022EB617B|nr:carboxypeptidase-like regulatory domain-containing protein [Roseomonas sp. MO-31]
MRLPRWMLSRWFIVPATLAAVVLGWNLHVAANATGEVRGRVVDATGRPVAGATVLLFERSFVVNTEKQRVVTDAAGAFRFQGNASHAVQLQADAPAGKSERVTLRLLFRAQDADLPAPLVIAR